MKQQGRKCPWRGVAQILGITFLFSSLLGTTVAQEIEQGHQEVTCPVTPFQQDREAHFEWPQLRHKVALHSDCWSSFDAISSKDIVLIDVRATKELEQHPLQDMRRIPLHTIDRDIGLKGKTILLVGTGFDQAQLDQACLQLRKQGINVTALTGGVRALLGTSWAEFSEMDESQITAEEFYSGSMTTSWKLIPFGLNDEQIEHLPDQPLTQNRKFKRLFQNQTTQNIEYVLVASDERATYALQQSIGKAGITNTVWLQGGVEAYENYIKGQYSIRTHAGKPLTRPCGGL